MKNYVKTLYIIFLGLLCAHISRADDTGLSLKEASFLRIDKPIVAIVFVGDDVGLLHIKSGWFSNDYLLLALSKKDEQKIRSIVSNTDAIEVAKDMDTLNELANNNNFKNAKERDRLGFAMNFAQYYVQLTSFGLGATIYFNLGLTHVPLFALDFEGLKDAVAHYKASVPNDRKLFFTINHRNPDVTISLYLPDYLKKY